MYYFIIPLLVLILIQILKLLIESVRGNFSWNHLFSNGGMPSAHSALVSSVATITAMIAGINSVLFAISFVFALLVVWDAFTSRFQIGYQGKIINKLIKELPDDEEYKYPLLSERSGHKLIEVLVGVVLGIVFSWVLIMLI